MNTTCCPKCGEKLKSFMRIHKNECVVFCSHGCDLEGAGENYLEAFKNLCKKVKGRAYVENQQELI